MRGSLTLGGFSEIKLFDLDSKAFARHRNTAWNAQTEQAGRVVII